MKIKHKLNNPLYIFAKVCGMEGMTEREVKEVAIEFLKIERDEREVKEFGEKVRDFFMRNMAQFTALQLLRGLKDKDKYVVDSSIKIFCDYLSAKRDTPKTLDRDKADIFAFATTIFEVFEFNEVDIENSINKKYADMRKELAKAGGKAKHKNDPKQKAKAEIREQWIAWQNAENPKAVYSSTSKFANSMMDKFNDPNEPKPLLESVQVILRWCTQWKKEQNTTHPA